MKKSISTQNRYFNKKIILIVLCNLLIYSAIFGQTRIVSGTLADGEGYALPGVNIIIKGTTQGTVTDMNGNYNIEAPIGSILVFSFIGYINEEYVVTSDGLVDPAKFKGKIVQPALPVKETTELSERDSVILSKSPVKLNQVTRSFHHKIVDDPEKTLSPYFFVKSDEPSIDRMPLKMTSADVNIAGVIADVKVKQVYVNEGVNTLEAVYIFPGSTRAAVYGMTMKIGTREIRAKIKEKYAARMEYEQAKTEGKTASLLEQKRPNVFQMNVANILPGDTIIVELSYTEVMEPVDGKYEFVYPTVVGPRYSETPDTEENEDENWLQNPYLMEGEPSGVEFDISVNINSGIPLQKLICTTHETNIKYSDRRNVNIRLHENEKYGGNRDFIVRYGLRGGNVQSGLLLHEQEDENFFLLMMEPPEAPEPSQIPPREYVFIVDVSGSMSGFPLNISKEMMRKLLNGMNENDYFNILLFAGGSRTFANYPVRATKANIGRSLIFINSLNGGGSTQILDALQNSFSLPDKEGVARTFVILTDGYVSVEKECFNLVRNNLNKANLFAFGIGSSVNRYIIEGLAYAGMGEPFVVTNQQEAKKQADKFREMIEKPVFTDIKIDFGTCDVYDVEPLSVPDIFANRPVMVFGKYKGSANGKIIVSGISGDKVISQTFDFSEASRENNQALRYLWARHRIKYLEDYAQYYTQSGYYNEKIAPNTEQIKEITDLGLKYNLLTNYTSFIAVDNEIRNTDGSSFQVKQPLPLPKGVSNNAVGNSQGYSTSYQRSKVVASGPVTTMTEDMTALTEVVVIGYGSMKRSDITGSVSSVNTENISQTSSLQNALQGRVSGVNIISNSGAPGSNYTVEIRGSNNTISGGPLYVVDGVVIETNENATVNPLLNIKTENIESVEVLKDASATSIYGSRGSNGVIIITTKKATPGQKKIDLTIKQGIVSMANKNKIDNNTIVPGTSDIQPWYNDLLQTGKLTDASICFNKGNEKTLFSTFLNYTRQKGIVEETGLEQVSASLSLEHKFRYVSLGGQYMCGVNNIDDVFHDYYNPLQQNEISLTKKLNNVMTSNFIKLDISKNIKLVTNFNYKLSDLKHSMLNTIESNVFSLLNYSENQYQQNYKIDPRIEYNLNFEDIVIKNQVRFELNRTSYKNTWHYNNTDLPLQEFSYDTQNITNREARVIKKDNMLLFRSNISWSDKYMATFNLSGEYSNMIISKDKLTWFPSFALAWNIGDESFMTNINEITSMKFRFSYGISGRNNLPVYSYLMDTTSNIMIHPLYVSGNYPEWEKSKQANGGLDIGLFNNHITISADIYKKNVKGAYVLNAETYGNTTISNWENAADISVKGFELSIDARVWSHNNSGMKCYFNMAANRSKLLKLYDENPGQQLMSRSVANIRQEIVLNEGSPVGVYYGYEINTINDQTGEITYRDLDGNGVVNENDRKRIANTNPDHYGGFGFLFWIKNISLNSFFKWSYGNDAINAAKVLAGQYNSTYVYPDRLSDFYVEDASHLRLSELTLVYNLTDFLKPSLRINNVELSVSAYNLFTITNYSWQDPEFNPWTYGEKESVSLSPMIDYGVYPRSRSFIFSLKMGF